MYIRFHHALIIMVSLLFHPVLYGQTAPVENQQNQQNQPQKMTQSLNVGLWGPLVDQVNFNANYVKIIKDNHAVVFEAERQLKGAIPDYSYFYGVLVGYRAYVNPGSSSFFGGINLRYKFRSEYWDNYAVLPNLGYRLQFDNGLNFTIRFGLGFGKTNFEQKNLTKIDLITGILLYYPINVDTELSIGYSF
jgi:hypothetical protein